MIDVLDEESATAAPAPKQVMEMSAKQRKPRKGTRSCWECKRRKIRCMFASHGDVTCIGCQHRCVPCVPQEVPEDPPLVKRDNRRLGERIARVEDFVNNFIANKQVGETSQNEKELRQERLSLASSDASRDHSHESSLRTPREVGKSSIIALNFVSNWLSEI